MDQTNLVDLHQKFVDDVWLIINTNILAEDVRRKFKKCVKMYDEELAEYQKTQKSFLNGAKKRFSDLMKNIENNTKIYDEKMKQLERERIEEEKKYAREDSEFDAETLRMEHEWAREDAEDEARF